MSFQLRRRADRPAHQFAAAIGAAPCEYPFGAIAAKGALIGTDAGVERVWRQIPGAALAIGPQFQHRHVLQHRSPRRILREKVGRGERLSL